MSARSGLISYKGKGFFPYLECPFPTLKFFLENCYPAFKSQPQCCLLSTAFFRLAPLPRKTSVLFVLCHGPCPVSTSVITPFTVHQEYSLPHLSPRILCIVHTSPQPGTPYMINKCLSTKWLAEWIIEWISSARLKVPQVVKRNAGIQCWTVIPRPHFCHAPHGFALQEFQVEEACPQPLGPTGVNCHEPCMFPSPFSPPHPSFNEKQISPELPLGWVLGCMLAREQSGLSPDWALKNQEQTELLPLKSSYNNCLHSLHVYSVLDTLGSFAYFFSFNHNNHPVRKVLLVCHISQWGTETHKRSSN